MIKLERVSKVFPGMTTPAVDQVSMEVPAGNICVLLGPSGCGKTTTLKMVNRLIEPSSGHIFIDGKDTGDTNAVELRRSLGYVIQQIGLFPNKTIEDNICIVPDILKWDRAKSRRRAAELLDMVGLDPSVFLDRFPKELSGGQQQRIGVLRALAHDPPVLLMDEPFGAIDPINREVIQDEFLKMQAQIEKTVMFVSHDIDEAIKMADRIAIFRDGKLVQYDSPEHLLAHPVNRFVSDFVGSDRTLKRLRLLKVSDVIMTDPPRVAASENLERATALMEEHGHGAIVVVGLNDEVLGFVDRATARDNRGKVAEHYEKLPTTIGLEEDLRTAVSTMFRHDVSWLACVHDGKYHGYMSLRGVSKLLSRAYGDND